MRYSVEKSWQAALAQRLEDGNLRQLKTAPQELVDFCSNDYLGFARHQGFWEAVHDTWRSLEGGVRGGATGSRLISGNHPYLMDLEAQLADWAGTEAALLFNSGYQANVAVLATLPQRGDTLLCDANIHASLRDGARLSQAKRYYFAHNDLEALEQKLQKKQGQGQTFVVVESVYSMDGDQAPLQAMAACCERYGAYLIVDEAHSIGVFGPQGRGLVAQDGLGETAVPLRVLTFGKAFGNHGACVVGSRLMIDYLTNFARTFIYTTAMPLHTAIGIGQALQWLETQPQWQTQLHQNIDLFCQQLKNPTLGTAPIQIWRVEGGNEAARQAAQTLQAAGMDVRPILAPTVPLGQECLRICLHATHSTVQIIQLCQALKQLSFHTIS
ncbi:aminotransferase class I/II-fold pyridoxal phosphate-dependent enzyme [Eisenibacter elegans]|uniref:aminotransferase class I/II-fold pyridoxal phosphate-dependent enzyme n=1 Tax=Eisenibacter elegans TaxID=997 RepID=UPI00047B46F3|nr:8-amino-7-oxononanoate synthase [Eisenibacter elegans]